MRDGWVVKPLGEVCTFTSGLWKGSKEPFQYVGVIRNTNFTKDGTLDDSDIAYLDVEVKKFEKRHLKFGDLILEKSGGGPKQPVGRVILFDKKEGKYSFSNFTSALRVLDPTIVNFYYLHKFLYWFYISGRTEPMQTNSTGIRNLNNDAYKCIEVPIPTINEQQRIVAKLDEAFDAIASAKEKAEKNLLNARALFDSYLGDVFSNRGEGWVDLKLSDVAIEFGRGRSRHRPRNDPTLYGGAYPFIQTGDVRNSSHLITNYKQTYNEVGLAQSKLWPSGTLCITIAANIAETGVLTFDACFPDSVIGVIPNETLTSAKFIEYQLQSFKVHLQKLGQGTAQDNINLATFETQLFPFPNLQQQNDIVKHIDDLLEQTQQLESLYQQKINALDELKQSLLHQAFSGEL